VETFGLVVIGAGPGGYPAAIRAAQLGASVALIEREELGGTCLNWGCIPTKTLIASSDLYARIKSAGELGIRVRDAAVDFGSLIERKNRVVGTLRNGVKQLLKANGVKIFHGTASFEGRNRIAVTAADPNAALVAVGAERTIIATGCTSSMPSFLPVHPRVVESRAFLDLTWLPASVIVLGGGIIGCEFACMLAQLGVKVTVVEILDDILWTLDADIRRELRRQMERNLAVRILTGVTLEEIGADDRHVRGRVGQEWLEADLLLAALGRKPVADDLKLERAGLKTNERGFIDVDEYSRTSVATIYAVGDVTGGPQLAHAATSQGLVAAENACSGRRRRNEKYVPNCIFTAPEIGTVGLSEQEAQQQGRSIKTGKFMLGALGKALAMGETVGFAKWVADAETDQLLGAHIIGPHATELIAEATAALRAELTVAELAHTIHAHPTLSEAWMEAAHVLAGKPVHALQKRKP